MIGILDYGAGNLMSVQNALRFLKIPSRILQNPEETESCKGLIVPGVGAFPDAMAQLNRSGFADILKREAESGKPILGICLGMQILFQEGEEGSITEGLGFLPGRVRKIPTSFKLPHIGWNSLSFVQESPLTAGVEEGQYVYFVHSYMADPDPSVLIAQTDYGTGVPAVVGRENVWGCQFHPEKSGQPGLQILNNFGEMCL